MILRLEKQRSASYKQLNQKAGITMPNYTMLYSLFEPDINIDEVLATYNIRTRVLIMDGAIHAFVWHSKKGRYYIVANECLSPCALRKVFFHEVKHILEDAPVMGYWLGIDQYRHPIEEKADLFYEIAAAYVTK